MTHPLLEIPELVSLTAGQGIVRIPPEQNVPFTPRVRAIVETPEFQRLSHITQLGLVARVYPGARHTRFEHALGVFNNSLKYLWQLGHDPRFVELVDTRSAELLMVAALLHDLGHWPFCHPIEDLGLPGLAPHEDLAAEFLSPRCELAQVLESEWHIKPHEVLEILSKRSEAPQQRLLRSILSGPIDIDKLDYLERDSLHAGVPYGRHFDKQRLIQSLILNEQGDGLAITSKGRTAAELMVFARYVMFSEVYWHHAVRAATAMFARAFYELHQTLNLRELFRLTEAEMIRKMMDHAAGTPADGLLNGVFGPRRLIYKRVVEYTLHHDPECYGLLARKPYSLLVSYASEFARQLGAEIGEFISSGDILIDAPPIHREVEFNIPIYYPRQKHYRRLDEVSPVVATLARTQFDDFVKRVRIFANPRHATALREIPDQQFGEILRSAVSAVDANHEAHSGS
ncbi:MAG: HD domain-containing protein [Planctomycetota bacterium]